MLGQRVKLLRAFDRTVVSICPPAYKHTSPVVGGW